MSRIDDLEVFRAKDSAYLDGVDTNLLRVPAALGRAFNNVDPETRTRLKTKHNFGDVVITDGMDHGLRSWESPHKHGGAVDAALFSVPDVPNMQISKMVERTIKSTVRTKHGNKTVTKTVTREETVDLKGEKAKEQFLADVATTMGISKFRASIHDVGFGNHIHMEHGDQTSVTKFHPAESKIGNQAQQDAESRLKQVFAKWGMDGDATLARIKDESTIGNTITRITQGWRNTGTMLADALGINDPEAMKKRAEQTEKLLKDARFTEVGGDQRLARVHDWIKIGKGSKPGETELKAYQAILASNAIDGGPIDGKPGTKTKAGANSFEKHFHNLSSVQIAQAVLGMHAESPEAITAAENRAKQNLAFNTPGKPPKYTDMSGKFGALPQKPIDLSKPLEIAKSPTLAEQAKLASLHPSQKPVWPNPQATAGQTQLAAAKPPLPVTTTTAVAAEPVRPAAEPKPKLEVAKVSDIKITSAAADTALPARMAQTAAVAPTTPAAPSTQTSEALPPAFIATKLKEQRVSPLAFGRVQQKMMGRDLGGKKDYATDENLEKVRKVMKAAVGEKGSDKELADAFAGKVEGYQEKARHVKIDGILGHETFKSAEKAVKQRRQMADSGPIGTQPRGA